MAVPMDFISRLFHPVIHLLSTSTDAVLKIFQLGHRKPFMVSGDEVRLLLQEGAQLGVFEAAERNIVEKALNLSEIKVNSLMTARNNVVWIEKDTPLPEIKKIIMDTQHSYYPVCDQEIDNVIGIVSADTLLTELVAERKVDFKGVRGNHILELKFDTGVQVFAFTFG